MNATDNVDEMQRRVKEMEKVRVMKRQQSDKQTKRANSGPEKKEINVCVYLMLHKSRHNAKYETQHATHNTCNMNDAQHMT